MANIFVTPDAQRQFDRLPKAIRTRILKLIERLQHWPEVSGFKQLSGSLAGRYRLRTGDYRLRFYIQAEDIFIDKIGHRANFYEE
jgi:mRNA-degrading endonuclease RelE of RelBE toxin-antitoxin system